MLEDIGWTLLAYVIAFVIDIVPAFMPSTWIVLAFFHIQFDLPILPLTLGGALFSGFGRIVLARLHDPPPQRPPRRTLPLEPLGPHPAVAEIGPAVC